MTSPAIIFTIASDNRKFLAYPHNDQFRVGDDVNSSVSCLSAVTEGQTPAPQLFEPTLLKITTAYKFKTPGVVLFGRDQELCDVLLDRHKKNGISREHFFVAQTPHGALILKNLSRNQIQIESFTQGSNTLYPAGTDGASQIAIAQRDWCEVDVGFKIRLEIPQTPAPFQGPHNENALELPLLENLSLESQLRASLRDNGYTLGSKLGDGTSGSVYRATNILTGKAIAVKQYHEHTEARQNEGKVMHLDHLLSITKWSNGLPPTLFMEFINGSHLADAHRLCPIKNRELKDLLNQLLQAVAFLHKSGVTHRDIKPANVMIIRRDEIFVKLADFDLASISTTSLEEFCGTPRYAAPEIMFGAKYNSKVDVWSLGIVGLEILHGLPNFSRKGWPNIISNHIASQNQTPILRFISKLVKKGPIERVSAQQTLDDGFFEADGAANENALPGGGQQHTPWRRTASSETFPDIEPWGCLAVVPEPGCQDVSDPKTVTHIITPSRPDPAGHDRSSAGPSVSRRKRLVVSKPSPAKEHRRSAANSLSYFTEAEYHETFLAPQNRSYLQLAVVSPKNAHFPVEIPSEGLYDSSLALPWSLHQAGDDLLTAANNSKSLQGPAGGSDKCKAMYRPLAPAQHPPMKTPQMHNERLVTGLAFCPTSVRQSGSDAQQQEDNGILNWNLATVGVATQKISPDSNVSRPQSETPRIQAKESHPSPQNVQNDKATNINGGFELSPHQERPFAPRPGGLSTRDVFNDKHIFKVVVKNRAVYALSGEPLYNLCEATAGNDYGVGNCAPPNAPATISGRESMTILGV
ncbi:hypothetical protein MCOR02_005970 [Pyricularia oryzae]|nr:hypothetical protein MCOR02_005970 [Pyricularia oryzae]